MKLFYMAICRIQPNIPFRVGKYSDNAFYSTDAHRKALEREPTEHCI